MQTSHTQISNYTSTTSEILQFQTEKPHFPLVKYTYDYTYYYTWLKQRESLIAEFPMTANSKLILTNKTLCVKTENKAWGENVKVIPLNHINNIEANFKRLLFPLIIGGIVAPMSIVSFFLHITTSIWTSIALSISGIFLMYYGWIGSHQIRITAYHSLQLNYFIDFKSPKLEHFVQEVQRLLHLHQDPLPNLELKE
jgi:hypothetical protein